MKPRCFVLCILLFSFLKFNAQNNDDQILSRAIIYQGDTLPYVALDTVKYYYFDFKGSNKEYIAFTKLVRDVKKAYPYAKLVANKVNEINAYLNTIKDPKLLEKEKID